MIRRLALVWVCCLIGLAGCSKPDQPGGLPPKASVSPSASASPGPSTSPDVKTILTTVARNYFAERNRAIETTNTARLRALAISSCPCNAFAQRIDEDAQRGSILAPGYYSVTGVINAYVQEPGIGFVTVQYRTNGYAVRTSSGRYLVHTPPDPAIVSSVIELRRLADGGWKVAGLVRL